jgi:hypothetical protein
MCFAVPESDISEDWAQGVARGKVIMGGSLAPFQMRLHQEQLSISLLTNCSKVLSGVGD